MEFDSHYLYLQNLHSIKDLVKKTLKSVTNLYRNNENVDDLEWHVLALNLIRLVKVKVENHINPLVTHQIMNFQTLDKNMRKLKFYEKRLLAMSANSMQ